MTRGMVVVVVDDVLDEKQDNNTLLRLRGILGAPLALDRIGLGAR